MKRILVLTACIVLCSTLTAKAVDDGWIRGVCTPQGGGMNKIDVYLISSTYPGGVLNAIEGTWSLTEPAAAYYLGGNSSTWRFYTTNVFQPATGSSYVNFDTKNDAADFPPGSGIYWPKTGVLPNITSFSGSWFTTDSSSRLSPTGNDLLATMYVSNGSWVQFQGEFGFINDAGAPVTITGGFLVPEPGTLVLLGMAGLALLAYAWRVASMKASCL